MIGTRSLEQLCIRSARTTRYITAILAFVLLAVSSPGSAWDAQINFDEDATSALTQAIAQAGGQCLDGQGKTYLVSGTIEVRGDVCLRNFRLLQSSEAAPDTSQYIRGQCPVGARADDRLNCGDRQATGRAASKLASYAYRRMLHVRAVSGLSPKVSLRAVQFDRGDDASAGSRSDSAALWIDGAREVQLIDVEITGAGKGYGLLLSNSRNVRTTRLHVHDLVWAPYRGDRPLFWSDIRDAGWNSPTIRELSVESRELARFYGTRIQEQLTCVGVFGSHDIVMEDTQIRNCHARIDGRSLPWQADGLVIGSGSHDIRIAGDSRISGTWEAIDLVGTGQGTGNIVIDGVTVSDTFAIGIKIGHTIDNVAINNAFIDGAGLAGMMIYGRASRVRVEDVVVSNIGNDREDAATFRQWPDPKAAIRVDGDGQSAPEDVAIGSVTVAGGRSCYAAVWQRSASAPRITGLRSTGCATSLRRD